MYITPPLWCLEDLEVVFCCIEYNIECVRYTVKSPKLTTNKIYTCFVMVNFLLTNNTSYDLTEKIRQEISK